MLMWHPSHATLPVELTEKAQRMCMQLACNKEAFLGGCADCTHFLPHHAWWYSSLSFPVRQLQMALSDTRPEKVRLLALAVKTLISVFMHLQCYKNRGGGLFSHMAQSNNFINNKNCNLIMLIILWFWILFFPSSFESETEFGEQRVKNVGNLLGSNVTYALLPVLPVWYWKHYGVENGVEFEDSWKMSVSAK